MSGFNLWRTVMTQQTEAGIAADAYCTTGTSPTARTVVRSSAKSQQGPAETPHPAHNHNGYESVGPSHLPTVVVLGGISAHRHVCATPDDPSPGWWDEVVGPHALGVDTNTFRVLGFDWLGGPNDPTKPICETVTTADQAIAIAKVLDELRIDSVAAIVGASYGGMVALAFASQFPSRVGHVVAISAAHRTHPMATALRSLQRRVVRFGRRTGNDAEGMSIARGIAMTTYRTTGEFEERFGVGSAVNVSAQFPVEGYLENRGRAFAESFRPESFLCLSESLDLHRVDPTSINVPLTLVAVDSDSLVPIFLARELAARTSGPCETHVIESQYGHDAFLKDRAAISEIVRTAIDSPTHVAGCSNVTAAVRAAIDTDKHYGAVMPAVHLSANFSFRDLDEPRAHDYSRSGNPTRDNLVDAIVALEHGAGGVVTSSGMSAIVVATQLLQPDDLMLAPIDCYGGTRRLFDSLAEQGRCRVEYAALSDPDQLRDIVAARRPKLIWVETPSNPLLRVTDLELVAECARDVGALLAVDNTFLSPALQNPIDFGAHLVVHSTTKFLNGHSDVVGGAVVARERDGRRGPAWVVGQLPWCYGRAIR